MHGLIGDRLLRRFAGRILELSEVTAPPEADSDQAEGKAAGKSGDRSGQTRRSSEMAGYGINLEQVSMENRYFRRVLFTGPKSQLVLMALQPGEDIGLEMHPNTDQFIGVESGRGRAVIDGQNYDLEDGGAIVIPAGAAHNVINTSQDAMLKLYTIYTPPEHPDGTVHKTRAEAQAPHRHERA